MNLDMKYLKFNKKNEIYPKIWTFPAQSSINQVVKMILIRRFKLFFKLLDSQGLGFSWLMSYFLAIFLSS